MVAINHTLVVEFNAVMYRYSRTSTVVVDNIVKACPMYYRGLPTKNMKVIMVMISRVGHPCLHQLVLLLCQNWDEITLIL